MHNKHPVILQDLWEISESINNNNTFPLLKLSKINYIMEVNGVNWKEQKKTYINDRRTALFIQIRCWKLFKFYERKSEPKNEFHDKNRTHYNIFASFVIKLILIPFYIASKIRIINFIEYSTLGIYIFLNGQQNSKLSSFFHLFFLKLNFL